MDDNSAAILFFLFIIWIVLAFILWNVVAIVSNYIGLTGIPYYCFQIVGCILLFKLLL